MTSAKDSGQVVRRRKILTEQSGKYAPGMTRVVIDTNVFVSSFFGGTPREIIDLWKVGGITLCLSQEIIREYLLVMNRMGLDDQQEIYRLTRLFSEGHNSIFSASTPCLSVVKNDPDDNKFIECAVALESRMIIAGNKHLKDIGKYVDVEILSPRGFMDQHAS